MTEHEIQSRLIELLLRARALVIRINSGRSGHIAYNAWQTLEIPRQTRGVSDLIALMPEGATWYIEVKAVRGRYADEQDMFRIEIEKRGGRYMTAEQVIEELTCKITNAN